MMIRRLATKYARRLGATRIANPNAVQRVPKKRKPKPAERPGWLPREMNMRILCNDMETFVTHCAAPIGILRISGTAEGVTGVAFLDGWEEHRASLRERVACPSVLRECAEQLLEYFCGMRKDLRALRVAPAGTEFQRSIWRALCAVPWGESMTYGELGRRCGYARAVRAVGAAVARNPIAIVIPCHRVMPANGAVGGYAWGAWRKRWLLRHETSHSALSPGEGGSTGGVGMTRRVL